MRSQDYEYELERKSTRSRLKIPQSENDHCLMHKEALITHKHMNQRSVSFPQLCTSTLPGNANMKTTSRSCKANVWKCTWKLHQNQNFNAVPLTIHRTVISNSHFLVSFSTQSGFSRIVENNETGLLDYSCLLNHINGLFMSRELPSVINSVASSVTHFKFSSWLNLPASIQLKAFQIRQFANIISEA